MSRSDLAALLIAGGMLVVLGSFSDWGACSQDPCEPELFGLMVITERSGIDVGWGILTAALGAALLLLGVGTLLGGARHPLVERVAAVAILLAVGVHRYLVTFGPSAADDGFTGTPYIGIYLTVIGAVVVLVASLYRPRESRAQPIHEPSAGTWTRS